MNYPFLYNSIEILDVAKIKKDLIYSNEKTTVWEDWSLISVESTMIRNFLKNRFPHLSLFQDKIYISDGSTSHFHLDRFHIFHLLHRILIPLDANYKYEWIIDEKTISYTPKIGEVILFNNMVPHRFVSDNSERREVIYVDLYDPLVEVHLTNFKGNYSEINGLLEKKYG